MPETLELQFLTWSWLGLTNVYLSDTRTFTFIKSNLSVDNVCKCQILSLISSSWLRNLVLLRNLIVWLIKNINVLFTVIIGPYRTDRIFPRSQKYFVLKGTFAFRKKY